MVKVIDALCCVEAHACNLATWHCAQDQVHDDKSCIKPLKMALGPYDYGGHHIRGEMTYSAMLV